MLSRYLATKDLMFESVGLALPSNIHPVFDLAEGFVDQHFYWPIGGYHRSVAAWMTGSSWAAANAAVRTSGSSASLRTIAVRSPMGSVAEEGWSTPQGSVSCSSAGNHVSDDPEGSEVAAHEQKHTGVAELDSCAHDKQQPRHQADFLVCSNMASTDAPSHSGRTCAGR